MVRTVQVSNEVGLRFVRALAAKDREALAAVLDPQVEFRGLTPSRSWEASNPPEVVEILLGSWFEPQDHIQETLEAEADLVEGRDRLHYRFRVQNDDGEGFLVEQHGYYDSVDGRITRMSLMCAGFRPWPN
jgi:hypothetical protein